MGIGEDPTWVMAQLGLTDPRFTRRVYAHPLVGDEAGRCRLRALVGAGRTEDAHRWPPTRSAQRAWLD